MTQFEPKTRMERLFVKTAAVRGMRIEAVGMNGAVRLVGGGEFVLACAIRHLAQELGLRPAATGRANHV